VASGSQSLRLGEDTPRFLKKGTLAADSFKSIEPDDYPGHNKAAAIVASLQAFSNRWNTNGPDIPSFHC